MKNIILASMWMVAPLLVACSPVLADCPYQKGVGDYLSNIADKTDYSELNEHGLYPKDLAIIDVVHCEGGKAIYRVTVARKQGLSLYFKISDGHVLYDTITTSYTEGWETTCMYSDYIADKFKADFCNCIRNSEILNGIFNYDLESSEVGRCITELNTSK